MEVIRNLRDKFNGNLIQFESEHTATFHEIDILARAFAALGEELLQEPIEVTQREVAAVFAEVFADIVLSAYYTGCGLYIPAKMELRRALELGIGIVYLWDLPHSFWGWKCHDNDLNFNDMLEHINRASYRTYIQQINKEYTGDDLFENGSAKNLYRDLSNNVHGKITTHVSNLANGFSYDKQQVESNLLIIKKVEVLLLSLYKKRYTKAFKAMVVKVPAVKPFLGE